MVLRVYKQDAAVFDDSTERSSLVWNLRQGVDSAW